MSLYNVYHDKLVEFIKDLNEFEDNYELHSFCERLQNRVAIKRIIDDLKYDQNFFDKTGKHPEEVFDVDYLNLQIYFAEVLVPLLKDQYLKELQEIFYYVLKDNPMPFQLYCSDRKKTQKALLPELFTKKIVDDILVDLFDLGVYSFYKIVPKKLLDYNFYKKLIKQSTSVGSGVQLCDSPYYLVPKEFATKELYTLALIKAPFIIENCENEDFVDEEYIKELFINRIDGKLTKDDLNEMYECLPNKYKTAEIKKILDEINDEEEIIKAIKKDYEILNNLDDDALCVDKLNEMYNKYPLNKIVSVLKFNISLLFNLDDKYKTKAFYEELKSCVKNTEHVNIFDILPYLPKEYTNQDLWIEYASRLLRKYYFEITSDNKIPNYVRSKAFFKKIVELHNLDLVNDDYEYSYYLKLTEFYGNHIFKIVPKELIDEQLLYTALDTKSENICDFNFLYSIHHDNGDIAYRNSLQYIPKEFIDDELVDYLREKNALYYNFIYLPQKYQTKEFVEEIKNNFQYPLNVLPEKYFTEEEKEKYKNNVWFNE